MAKKNPPYTEIQENRLGPGWHGRQGQTKITLVGKDQQQQNAHYRWNCRHFFSNHGFLCAANYPIQPYQDGFPRQIRTAECRAPDGHRSFRQGHLYPHRVWREGLLSVGLVAVSIGLIGGLLFGAVAGFVGGITDDILMRMMDALLAFPPLLLAIGLVASMGPSLKTVSISIGVVYIPRFARVMRSSVLAEKEKEYVEAARAIGQSGFKILIKHIGPSTISPMIVLATIIFALAIIIEATLSFLGVGLPPPAPSWGTMLDESRRYLSVSVWMALFPGITISIAVLGFNMVGDGLRDLLDPRSYN